ncbi:hypothetical protein SK128_020504, partial [Halocaridina rubra]
AGQVCDVIGRHRVWECGHPRKPPLPNNTLETSFHSQCYDDEGDEEGKSEKEENICLQWAI